MITNIAGMTLSRATILQLAQADARERAEQEAHEQRQEQQEMELRRYYAEHGEWPLHRARVLRLEQDLLARAGLPAPAGDPLAHASPGVPVRIGMWHR